MESRIGTILREARKRRKIDLSEVEAATKIRLRYLQAIENDEWDALPGGVYTRGFIRTYASFLGLDGERIADDYRKSVEAAEPEPAARTTSAPLGPAGRWTAARNWLAIAAVILVAVLAITVIPGGGDQDGDRSSGRPQNRKRAQGANQPAATTHQKASSPGVSVRLAASAEVWVCILDAKGEPLVDGQILEAGAEEGPFRSGSFTVSFGNGEVSMLVDGREAEIPATSSPLGYSIDSSGDLTELSETERPSCT